MEDPRGTGPLFVIGDIRGCLQTFTAILQHWNYHHEILVQVGDLINGGKYSPEVVSLARQLELRFAGRAIFLLGCQESKALDYFERQNNPQWLSYEGGSQLLESYIQRGYSLANDAAWFDHLPLWWENTAVLISHAGVSASDAPFSRHHADGIVHNKTQLLNIGKLQIIGHVPVDEPSYSNLEHCWRIGTVYTGKMLTALRLDVSGNVAEIVRVPVSPADGMG